MKQLSSLVKRIILFFLLFVSFAYAETSESIFYKGISHYNMGEYQNALNQFRIIEAQGVKNGKLYYNIGNTYFNLGDKGRSVLYYEKAIKLIPNDPDLLFNYKHVKSLLTDKTEEKDFSLLSIFFFWNKSLSLRQVQLVALSLNVIFWSVTVYLMLSKHKRGRSIQYLLFFLTLISVVSVGYDEYTSHYQLTGIVVNGEVSVRSGLSDQSTVLFKLHEGTKVAVQKKRDQYTRIQFSKDKIGWIENKNIEEI